jgi:hypothetical protein
MPDIFKKTIKNLLLIFVFVSIGFALGKYSVSRQKTPVAGTKDINTAEVVHVYYMHATFRCVTCNTIEKMTKELLDSKFAKELKKKEIIFSEVNFQEDEKLAKKFDVISSCVVVAKEKNGKIIDYKRLDGVWTLLKKPNEFNDYISKPVETYLAEKEKTQ